MRKFISAILLLIFISSAAGFTADLNTVKEKASPGNPAVYHLTVNNDDTVNRTYRLKVLKFRYPWFGYDSYKKIAPGENETFVITANPGEDAIQQRYRFDTSVREIGTEELHKNEAYVSVVREFNLNVYTINIPKSTYKPGEELNITVETRNVAEKTVRDYNVELEYLDRTYSKEATPTMPGGTRSFKFDLSIPYNTTPGEKEISLRLIGKDSVQNFTRRINIAERAEIDLNQSVDDKILIYNKEVRIKNTGNTPTNYTYSEQVPAYVKPITNFDQDPVIKNTNDGESVYRWAVSLEPGESENVQYTINYWIPVGGLVVVVFALVGIRMLSQPLKFRKTAEKTDDGVRVRIEIENTSERSHSNLKVEDFIPDIAVLSTDFKMAKPQIRRTNEGARLTWNIEELGPGDQRVLQYNIQPRVTVEGGAKLRSAKIKNSEGEVMQDSNEIETEFNS